MNPMSRVVHTYIRTWVSYNNASMLNLFVLNKNLHLCENWFETYHKAFLSHNVFLSQKLILIIQHHVNSLAKILVCTNNDPTSFRLICNKWCLWQQNTIASQSSHPLNDGNNTDTASRMTIDNIRAIRATYTIPPTWLVILTVHFTKHHIRTVRHKASTYAQNEVY